MKLGNGFTLTLKLTPGKPADKASKPKEDDKLDFEKLWILFFVAGAVMFLVGIFVPLETAHSSDPMPWAVNLLPWIDKFVRVIAFLSGSVMIVLGFLARKEDRDYAKFMEEWKKKWGRK